METPAQHAQNLYFITAGRMPWKAILVIQSVAASFYYQIACHAAVHEIINCYDTQGKMKIAYMLKREKFKSQKHSMLNPI